MIDNEAVNWLLQSPFPLEPSHRTITPKKVQAIDGEGALSVPSSYSLLKTPSRLRSSLPHGGDIFRIHKISEVSKILANVRHSKHGPRKLPKTPVLKNPIDPNTPISLSPNVKIIYPCSF
ncbi:unnamed protein product [Prunus armeniaca]|uniref:Uncharacterized protein n=1 Tax=Prunus armeniaca TaxID=36596 RepID=A0A6J5V7X4_PRUAR|nr:unnamed protein product [Prunus armeniaca]